MADNPFRRAHQEWIGNVRPEGLLVSLPALELAQAAVDRNPMVIHRAFVDLLPRDRRNEPIPELPGFSQFAERVLGWPMELYGPPPENLHTFLETYREDLRPTAALLDPDGNVLLVISEVPRGTDFDSPPKHETRGWNASPYARLERLLRETGHPVGILASPEAIRLVYAPKGESSAHATFNVSEMVTVQGRILLGALHMLLGTERLYSGRPYERLHGILRKSREFQNDVSTKLSRQVLEALYALLHGFQHADDYIHGELLRETLARHPNKVYEGLLTVLMRLVFLLYAEDRGLMSQDSIYSENYSVSKLFEQLREDKQRYPEQMFRRYGAWSRLLALFRLVYGGGSHGRMRIPARHGYLFDPALYPFLAARDAHGKLPHVPDGTILEVLQRLLMLDEERLSYRALDVEQIGSVYEAVMGFELHVAQGPSIAIRAKKRWGAPVTINLEALLRIAAADRNKWLKKNTDQEVTGTALAALKSAATVDYLQAALKHKIHLEVTPVAVRAGAMVFQPSPERRRSGSYYTPRTLTKPIVLGALEPVLKELGPEPKPDQILALRICDPAMGSGAFLVEACRQLGQELVNAWQRHGGRPVLEEEDEDELLLAQRVVAQRCLYGVDKNRMAVDLAKLSLWLATLAKGHSFTFLNHTLKHGDSLVGLTPRRIASVDWAGEKPLLFLENQLRRQIERASRHRTEILQARDDTSYDLLQQKLAAADEQLELARMVGDAACAVFFRNEKPKAQTAARLQLIQNLEKYVDKGDLDAGTDIEAERMRLRHSQKPVVPFHWQIEFPEVFLLNEGLSATRGFDAIVGNPPFAGKNTMAEANADAYPDWLKEIHSESHGNSDLVAHFFRRAYSLLRNRGCFGLIATNTIGQGDTRFTGLRWIRNHDGTIYRAVKRLPWPGEAAVIVSVVHASKGLHPGPYLLGTREVPVITAYLFHRGGDENPAALRSNRDKSFQGSIVLGMGFTFDDTDKDHIASPLSRMRDLIQAAPRNKERIFPYIGGEEVNDDPEHKYHRYVINFEDFPLKREPRTPSWADADDDWRKEYLKSGIVPPDYPEPVADDWPDLLSILEERVRPERLEQKDEYARHFWWRFLRTRPEMRAAMSNRHRVLVCARIANAFAFTQISRDVVCNEKIVIFAEGTSAGFAVMQSRVHEVWARVFSATLKDDLQYTPSDCFETFPFPSDYERSSTLEAAGREYYEFRASLMIRNQQGLTKTYNRFHNPEEQSADFKTLRALHRAMDRAVLDAYCWKDIQAVPNHEPEFDDEQTDDDELSGAKKPKQKYRLRWPEEIRDDVLARLLILNEQRAAAEALETKTKKKRSKRVATPLFDSGD